MTDVSGIKKTKRKHSLKKIEGNMEGGTQRRLRIEQKKTNGRRTQTVGPDKKKNDVMALEFLLSGFVTLV